MKKSSKPQELFSSVEIKQKSEKDTGYRPQIQAWFHADS